MRVLLKFFLSRNGKLMWMENEMYETLQEIEQNQEKENKIEKGKNTLRKMKEMGSLLSKLVRTWVWIGKSSQWPFQSGQILPH